MSSLEKIIRRFKEQGYKMTPQRRAILEVLTDGTSHLTAEQLYNLVKEHIPGISLATVYNTLRELTAIQELRELDLGQGERHFEIRREEHAHQVCLTCGRIRDVPVDLEQLQSLLQPNRDFVPSQCAVTIYGHCSDHLPLR